MFHFQIVLIALAIFGGVLVCFELGKAAANRQIRHNGEDPGKVFTALEGSVFGLMTLLLAFTFSSASGRFEVRRQLVVREASSIEVAWKRTALLPDPYQTKLYEKLKQYLDARLDFYTKITDREAALAQIERATSIQEEMWTLGIAGTEGKSPAVISLMLTSLNSLTEINHDSLMLSQMHLPGLIQALLIVLPLICASLAGFEASKLSRRFWLPLLLFALMTSLTVMVIFDLEYPRVGLIRLDAHDQILVDLQKRMQGQ